jgi:putative transposase
MPSRLRRYDVPGHVHFWTISCYRRLGFFHHDELKQAVIDGLRALQVKFTICLMGYVVMPEHVHILLYPHARGSDQPIPVSTLLEVFKTHSGLACKERLREYWREHGRLWSEPLNRWARGERKEQAIWKPRGYDFNIDRRETFIEKLNYCHKNPITRGLVGRAADWPWSSYRFYEMDDSSVLAMDWDGRWPIVW